MFFSNSVTTSEFALLQALRLATVETHRPPTIKSNKRHRIRVVKNKPMIIRGTSMISLKALAFAIAVTFIGTAASAQSVECGSDTLCRVKAAGILKIGTKDDYVP